MSKPHQGDILRDLIRRSPMKSEEIAEAWGISPAYLSRQKAAETLSESIIQKAVDFFGVPRDIFETGIDTDQADTSKNEHEKLERLRYLLQASLKENERLNSEVSRLQSQLNAALRREMDLIGR